MARTAKLYLPLDVDFFEGPRVEQAGEKAAYLYLAMCCAAKERGTVTLTQRQISALLLPQTAHRLEALLDCGWITASDEGYRLAGPCLRELERPRYRPWIPAALRRAVFARDGHTCLECGATGHLTLDHIYPYSRGGADIIENLRALCLPCNQRKAARI